jgi:hypothetical protein
MSTILGSGALLGVLVVAWMFVMGFTGWYKDPRMLLAFFLVIPIQIVVLVLGLRRTAAAGRGYGGQVVAGTRMSVVASVLIFGGSLLFTNVAFPRYFDELAAVQEQMLVQAGRSPEQVATEMAAYRRQNTPVANALNGVIGTVVTGLVVSLVAGAFIRAKR